MTKSSHSDLDIERKKVKLDLMEHRAFWWFIEDLQNLKGPESDIKGLVITLKKLYEQSTKVSEKKYKQGNINFI